MRNLSWYYEIVISTAKEKIVYGIEYAGFQWEQWYLKDFHFVFPPSSNHAKSMLCVNCEVGICYIPIMDMLG